ncbi:Ig-like domain-containing protein [Flavobacterium ginsengiterrae]|uniref:PA14 domain-containing protein n=1 Tax=Flavobacterium ginsengiterrae TaxID=871695 RepID=A0ABP7GAR3_9FLAO
MKKTLLLFLFLLPFFGIAQTDLAKWNAVNSGYAATNISANVSAQAVTAVGASLEYVYENDTDVFYRTGNWTGPWPNPSQFGGEYNPDRYIQFAIKPNSGNKIDLSTFTFQCRSGSGKFRIKYSKSSSFTTDVKDLLTETANQGNWTTYTLPFSTEINPVLDNETVYVRIYSYSTWNTFEIRTGTNVSNVVPLIRGAVSSFDSNKILAINDYVNTKTNLAININALKNDVKKENVTSLTITTPPTASQGTAIINPDRTITFNPAQNFTGTSTFSYTISDGTQTSTATVRINIANDIDENLSLWNGAGNSFNPITKTYVDPNSPITANNVSMGYIYENTTSAFFQTGTWQGTWPTPEQNGGSYDANKYIQFKINPDQDHELTLKQFSFTYRNNGGKFRVVYSKDSNFQNDVRVWVNGANTANNWTTVTYTFASDISPLLYNQTMYIRIYAYSTNNTFEILNGNGNSVGPVITGTIKDVNTLLANNDYKSTPVNQAITIKVLENDVVGKSSLQPITVTQPANGTATVNAANEITFTPSSGFLGTTSFTYTLRNANSNYSSATVYINGTAAICAATPTAGNNYWKGYVYTFANNTTPAATTYVGSIAEKANFDRNVGTGTISGDTTVEPNNFCGTVPSDYALVRYYMQVNTTVEEIYNFTIGADDGVRLYVDGVLVTGLATASWGGSNSYVKYAALRNLTVGTHNFVLEYYENAGSSRVSFSYAPIKGNPALPFGINKWNVYGFTTVNITGSNTATTVNIPANSYAGSYEDTNTNVNSQTYWNKTKSPSIASGWQGAPISDDDFTVTYKRKGFPCGSYQIQLVNCDDVGEIYLNGTRIFLQNGYTTAASTVGTYTLNSTSEIEVRLGERGGDANIAVSFTTVPVYYDGSTTPAPGTAITINSNTTLASDLTVCSCTVKTGVTLTVPKDRTLTIDDALITEGTGKLLISDGGALLQNNTTSSAFQGGVSNFVMERKTVVRRYDYTYWSSPLTLDSKFTLYKMSPNTLADKYTSYNPNASWVIHYGGGVDMVPGEGYSVRGPQNFDIVTASTQTASFEGIPNNGDVPKTVVKDRFNLLGNPYPSAIDGYKLIRDTNIGTIYLWTHNTPPAGDGSGKYKYASADYAAFNLSGSVRNGGDATGPTGYIAAGQGFFAKPITTSITYTNAMRVGNRNNNFYKTAKTENLERNRLWLNLSNAEGAFKQTLVGYIEGATNGQDLNYDAASFNGNSYVDFYSINETVKFSIQARALPFDNADVIPLGYKSTVAGDFKISIDHVDGFFDNQNVYLEDKTTGVISDLKAGDYNFKTEAGTFADRFTLRYTNKTLGTDDFENVDGGLLVSVKDKVIRVTSSKENIKDVSLFDISGKVIYQKGKVGTTEHSISNLQSSDQILLVKITLENNYTTTKKVIFK